MRESVDAWRSWTPVDGVAAIVAGAIAVPAARATSSPALYIRRRVTQSRESSARTIASVWLAANVGMRTATDVSVGYPPVYLLPWHTA